MAAFLLLAMGAFCLWLPVSRLEKNPQWLAIGTPLASGFTVAGVIEAHAGAAMATVRAAQRPSPAMAAAPAQAPSAGQRRLPARLERRCRSVRSHRLQAAGRRLQLPCSSRQTGPGASRARCWPQSAEPGYSRGGAGSRRAGARQRDAWPAATWTNASRSVDVAKSDHRSDVGAARG